MNKLKAFLAVSASVTLLSVFGCASVTPYVEPPLPEGGTKVPGESLADKLGWLETHADSRNLYIVEVNADENVAPRKLEYEGAADVTVVLKGVGESRTLRLASHGTMFTVKPNVTFILDENITLHGHSQNTGPMVEVDGGNFVMRSGSVISGNENTGRPYHSGDGGGVYVRSGNFKMTGFAIISENTADNGGGVFVSKGTFEMHCGMIYNNIAKKKGGGVYSSSSKRVLYSGDYYNASNFTMGVRGKDAYTKNNGCAMIAGNTAREEGGGVYTTYETYYIGSLSFLKHGLVAGYNPNNTTRSNVVKDEGGNILSEKGHAASTSGPCYRYYYADNIRRSERIPCGMERNIGEIGDGGWGDVKSMISKSNSEASAPAAAATPTAAPPKPPTTVSPEAAPPVAAAPPPAPVPETAVINNSAATATAAGSTSIDPRLTGGSWWNGKSGGDCTKWSFGADGKMSLEFFCEVYNNDFTAANGQIKFLKKIDVCDEDGCQSVDMPGREYSFSDDGKTLILDKERFTKGGPASCCPH